MNDKQWTEYFFYQNQRVRVMLTPENIRLQHQQGQEFVSLDFSSKFQTIDDKYGNLICLVIYSKRSITLAHDNPTVLEQWQQILNKVMHQTDFHRYFQPKNKIGEGITSNVFLAWRKSDKRKMSVKVFSKSRLKDSKDLLALQNEMDIIKSIKGDFFPQFIASFSTENSYYLVYEWCEGISLKQWVSKGLSHQKQMKRIVLSICDALKLLNIHSLVHRDIKPENIIYDLSSHKIKVIDFGFATKFTSQCHIYPNCGTPGYSAPEVLDKSKALITPQVDIFSLGITTYFLVFGKLPYSSKYNLLKANKDCLFSFDHFLSQKTALNDLLKRMICPLKYRLTVDEVINHSYFKQQEVICNRSLLKTQIFMKLQSNEIEDLDILNRKMEKKREQRLRRQRMISVRNQSQMRACSHEKSSRNRRRFVTEIF